MDISIKVFKPLACLSGSNISVWCYYLTSHVLNIHVKNWSIQEYLSKYPFIKNGSQLNEFISSYQLRATPAVTLMHLGCFLTTGDLGSYPHCCIKLAQSRLTRQASWFQMVSVNLFKLIGNNWNRKKKNCYCGFLWAWCFVAMHFLASEWLVFLFLLITLWFYWTCVTNFPVINSENARVFVPNGWVGETELHLKSTPIISNGFSLKAQHWDGHISKHF